MLMSTPYILGLHNIPNNIHNKTKYSEPEQQADSFPVEVLEEVHAEYQQKKHALQ